MSGEKEEITLAVRCSQTWLIAYALSEMTDDAGIEKFLNKYPNCDQDAIAEDLDDLMSRIAKAARVAHVG